MIGLMFQVILQFRTHPCRTCFRLGALADLEFCFVRISEPRAAPVRVRPVSSLPTRRPSRQTIAAGRGPLARGQRAARPPGRLRRSDAPPLTRQPGASTSRRMVLASGRTREAASHKSKVALDFALAALRAGDVAGAELRLRDALLADPFNADALVKLAEIAVEQRRLQDPTLLMRKAVTACPNPDRRPPVIYQLPSFGRPRQP